MITDLPKVAETKREKRQRIAQRRSEFTLITGANIAWGAWAVRDPDPLLQQIGVLGLLVGGMGVGMLMRRPPGWR